MSGGRRKRVVIVGGGIAGLTTAEAIIRDHAEHFHVTLLEAKRVSGGRAGSFLDPKSGQLVDYCQHVAMGCCTNLLALLRRCDLEQRFHRYQQLVFLHPSCESSRFVPSAWLPPPLHLLPALSGLRFLSAQQRGEIRRGLWRLMRADPRSLITERAGPCLRRWGQSDKTLRRFWDVILVSALGERTESVSMAAVHKVLIDGFAGTRHASDLLVPQQPLSEIIGKGLPEAIEKLGVTVRTSTPIRRLATQGRELLGVQTSGGETIPADHVVSAVPWHAAGRLLRDSAAASVLPSLAAWESFPASPVTGVHLWFDRQITRRPHAVLVGTAAQWLFRDAGRCGQPPCEHYYQVVISAAHAAQNKDRHALVEQVVAELRQALPDAGEATLIRSRVVTDPQAVFSIQPEVETERPPANTPLPWLHLAGDWIATGWPATMEGAVISGRLAAASLLSQEGLTPSPIHPGLPRGWLAKQLIVAAV